MCKTVLRQKPFKIILLVFYVQQKLDLIALIKLFLFSALKCVFFTVTLYDPHYFLIEPWIYSSRRTSSLTNTHFCAVGKKIRHTSRHFDYKQIPQVWVLWRTRRDLWCSFPARSTWQVRVRYSGHVTRWSCSTPPRGAPGGLWSRTHGGRMHRLTWGMLPRLARHSFRALFEVQTVGGRWQRTRL